MNLKRIISGAVLAILPFSGAVGQELDYNYVEAGAQFLSGGDEVDLDGEGVLLGFSYRAGKQAYVTGRRVAMGFFDTTSLGAGFIMPQSEQVDLYGELNLVSGGLGIGGGFGTTTGVDTGALDVSLEGGARMLLADNLEGRAALGFNAYRDSDADNEIFLDLEGIMHFNSEWAATLGYQRTFDSKANFVTLGARFHY